MAECGDKGKTINREQWPGLITQHRSGGGKRGSTLDTNGIVELLKSPMQDKLSTNRSGTVKPWVNLFASNNLAAKGMNLNYIPPLVIEGEKVFEILVEDVAHEEIKWAAALIVYVVGNSPSIRAMERFIAVQSKSTTKPAMLYHNDGYFVVRLENEEERDKVLCSDSHYMMRKPVIMKSWTPEFNFKEEILTTIPLWVKLANLPLNCWMSIVVAWENLYM